jgi:hypothetical protein
MNNTSKRSIINIDTAVYSVTGMNFELPSNIVTITSPKTGDVQSQGNNRLPLSGQGGHNLTLRTFDFQRRLRVEGSLGGFLFGQNLHTSANLHGMCLATLKHALGVLGLKRSEDLVENCKNGDIELDRLDLACNFALDSELHVKAILGQLRRQFAVQNCYTKSRPNMVVYCPDKGRNYEIAIYAKGLEMRRSPRLKSWAESEGVIAGTRNILRIEVRLRGDLEVRRMQKVCSWTERKAETTFWEYLDMLKLDQVTSGLLLVDELNSLPMPLRPLFAQHKAGIPLDRMKMSYSTATFQRHKSALLARGVNIGLPNVADTELGKASDVITAERAVTAVPQWLEDAGRAPFKLPGDLTDD